MQPPNTTGHLRAVSTAVLSLTALFAAPSANASFLSGDALAKAANVLAVIVIIIVPIVGIVVFWMVHVLPEKIAHKNQHPQTKAIQVLCLLSLVFGGMLWPIAWLWAYTKPVLYKMAYGTDQGEAHDEPAGSHVAPASGDLQEGIARVRADIEKLASQGGAPRELAAIRDQLAVLESSAAGPAGEAR